jgi:hypothetical protein
VNDQGNKLVAPPKKILQIFTNPMPNNKISFVKGSDTENNDVMNVDIDIEEMVGLVEIEPRKAQTKKPLDIHFSSRDILKSLPNGPLYIDDQINNKPTNGLLIYLVCGENVIIEEFLLLHELYKDTYDRPKGWTKTHNVFAYL